MLVLLVLVTETAVELIVTTTNAIIWIVKQIAIVLYKLVKLVF